MIFLGANQSKEKMLFKMGEKEDTWGGKKIMKGQKTLPKNEKMRK